MSDLNVQYQGKIVGRAVADDAGRFAFTYAGSWLDSPDAFPISANLPMNREKWPADRAHPFFANLLPEGLARQSTCEQLGISPDNDVALLNALGDDTAGAFRFVPVYKSAPRNKRERQPISDTELKEWAEGAPALPNDPDHRPRLSLAGAQHKTSVVLTDHGYALPASGEPSTHILKFESPKFSHLAANEFLTTRFAAELDIDTVHSSLDDQTSPPILVVKRYDRSDTDSDNQIRRIHQEDFCQLLGILPSRKYGVEGGPTIGRVATRLRHLSSAPAADVLKLLRWVIFCAISGNADGHAKNLSMLYSKSGMLLAPAYDLVCTRTYSRLTPNMAFAIGGQRNSDRLLTEHWEQFAEDVDVRPRLVFRELQDFLTNADDALGRARDQLREEIGETQAGQQISRTIRKRIRAIRTHI